MVRQREGYLVLRNVWSRKIGRCLGRFGFLAINDGFEILNDLLACQVFNLN